MSYLGVAEQCQTRGSYKSVTSNCQLRVSHKWVRWKMWQISIVSVLQHTCRHSGSWASSCFRCLSQRPFSRRFWLRFKSPLTVPWYIGSLNNFGQTAESKHAHSIFFLHPVSKIHRRACHVSLEKTSVEDKGRCDYDDLDDDKSRIRNEVGCDVAPEFDDAFVLFFSKLSIRRLLRPQLIHCCDCNKNSSLDVLQRRRSEPQQLFKNWYVWIGLDSMVVSLIIWLCESFVPFKFDTVCHLNFWDWAVWVVCRFPTLTLFVHFKF